MSGLAAQARAELLFLAEHPVCPTRSRLYQPAPFEKPRQHGPGRLPLCSSGAHLVAASVRPRLRGKQSAPLRGRVRRN